jgi:asparagine synthase (glutamine-hydrolysing)
MSAARGTLTLAVDPFGQKPLYYSKLQNGGIAFASELTALLSVPEIEVKIAPDSLSQYFLFDCVPAPSSLLQHVSKVKAGSGVVWESAFLHHFSYYDPQAYLQAVDSAIDGDPIAGLSRRIAVSVSRHIDEVSKPGLLLSSGIDSGLLATELARQAASRTETYTIAYEGSNLDEAEGAEQVAKFLGLRHQRVTLPDSQVPDLVTLLARHLDEPIADPATIPLLQLFHLISKETRVVLTGDGGDELFNGYPRRRLAYLCKMADLASSRWRAVAPRLAKGRMMNAAEGWGMGSARGKIFNLLCGDADELYRQLSHIWRPWLLHAILPSRFPPNSWTYTAALQPLPSRLAWPIRATHFELNATLSGILLVKSDRCSMAAGAEARAPFLDRLVADFSLQLHEGLKCRRGKGKWILKEILRDRLPGHLVSKRKRGFGVPLAKWMRTCLKDMVSTYVLSPVFVQLVGMNPAVVNRILSSHLSGHEDQSDKLWSLLVLALWCEQRGIC